MMELSIKTSCQELHSRPLPHNERLRDVFARWPWTSRSRPSPGRSSTPSTLTQTSLRDGTAKMAGG